MTIDQIIAAIHSKARGRTRWVGMEQPWDEQLAAEIVRLRKQCRMYRDEVFALAGALRRSGMEEDLPDEPPLPH